MVLDSAAGESHAIVARVSRLLGLWTLARTPVTTSLALLRRASIKLGSTASIATVFDPERNHQYPPALLIQMVKRVAPTLVKHQSTTLLQVVVVVSLGQHAISSVNQVRHFSRHSH